MLQYICCVSPILQEVSQVLGPGRVNKLQENKAITMKAFEVKSFVSFFWAKVSASDFCVFFFFFTIAARWANLFAYQPLCGCLHHQRVKSPLEIRGRNRGKHRQRSGRVPEHQTAAGEDSLPLINAQKLLIISAFGHFMHFAMDSVVLTIKDLQVSSLF